MSVFVVRTLDRPGEADDISAIARPSDGGWIVSASEVGAIETIEFDLEPGASHALDLALEAPGVELASAGDFSLSGATRIVLSGDRTILSGFTVEEAPGEVVSIVGDDVTVREMRFVRCGDRDPERAWQAIVDIEPGAQNALVTENAWTGSYSIGARVVQGAAADGQWADGFAIVGNRVEDDQPAFSDAHLNKKVAGFQIGQGGASDHPYHGRVVGNRIDGGVGQSTAQLKASAVLFADNSISRSPKFTIREGENNMVVRNTIVEPRNDAPPAHGLSSSDREAAGVVIRSSNNVVAHNVIVGAGQDGALAITWGREGTAAPPPSGNLIHDNTIIQTRDSAVAPAIGFPVYGQEAPPRDNRFENNLVVRTTQGRLLGVYGHSADEVAALQDWGESNLFFALDDAEPVAPIEQRAGAMPSIDPSTGRMIAADPALVDRGVVVEGGAPGVAIDGRDERGLPDIGAFEWRPDVDRTESSIGVVDDRAEAARLGLGDGDG